MCWKLHLHFSETIYEIELIYIDSQIAFQSL